MELPARTTRKTLSLFSLPFQRLWLNSVKVYFTVENEQSTSIFTTTSREEGVYKVTNFIASQIILVNPRYSVTLT